MYKKDKNTDLLPLKQVGIFLTIKSSLF